MRGTFSKAKALNNGITEEMEKIKNIEKTQVQEPVKHELIIEEKKAQPQEPVELVPTMAKSKKESSKKVAYNFRTNAEDLETWKQYAKCKGRSLTSLINIAVNSFIREHPLTEEEKEWGNMC